MGGNLSKRSALTVLVMLLISFAYAYSIEYLDTKGRDFWLTFIPNSHKNFGPTSTDSLFVFISADQPAQGTIEYYDRNGNSYSQPFTITQPNSLFTFKLQYYYYELWGYKTESNLDTRYQSETVSKMAFHITSDNEISVYAHSQAKQTSDAFLVMPTDVIGKNYIVTTYNSDGNKVPGNTGNGPTPCEFAVIASEDSTLVTIKPKTATEYNGTNIQRIMLNKGEVYLVQAKMVSPNLRSDLTGTTIDATRPVAVFAGNQKSLIPSLETLVNGSRDCLMEQIPPTKVWGKNAFITPFRQPSNVTASYNDLFRIIAANDSTNIKINNVWVATLNRGEYYQGNLTSPSVVTADAPFLLVKYKKTSDYAGGSNYGDPFMLVVPPKEQFMNSYTTINVQAWEITGKVYFEQYITIVIPTVAIGSFRLDGNPVSAGQFSVIPNSNYSYANISVKDGVHNTKADSAFGIYIYGYGTANSFGYTGGMSFAPIDYQAPQISSIDSCYQANGFVYDSLVSDSGILGCYSPDTSHHNCLVTIGSISADGKSMPFHGELIDKRFDGSFAISAIDSNNQKNFRTIEIKGFTLGVKDMEFENRLLDFYSKINTGTQKCFQLELHNYGKFSQTLNSFRLLSPQYFTVKPNFPLTVKPGEIDTLTICFMADRDSIYIDTLSIINECGDLKSLAAFNLHTGQDRNPPQYIIKADSCNQNFIITVTDSMDWDSDISSIICTERSNCSIEIKSVEPGKSTISVTITNSAEDMSYKIEVRDAAGHLTVIADTLTGVKLKISAYSTSDFARNVLNFGRKSLGKISLDSIALINSGLNDIVISNLRLSGNVDFSVPQSQFPLIIKSLDTTKAYIAFRPTRSDSIPFIDTLSIDTYCINQSIILKGLGLGVEFNSSTRCGSEISIGISSDQGGLVISGPNPNPVYQRSSLMLTVKTNSDISIDLFNCLGIFTKRIWKSVLYAGNHNVEFDTVGIPSGVYYIRVSDGTNSLTEKVIIVK